MTFLQQFFEFGGGGSKRTGVRPPDAYHFDYFFSNEVTTLLHPGHSTEISQANLDCYEWDGLPIFSLGKITFNEFPLR